MLFQLHRHARLILGLIWSSAFMLMLAQLLYGQVSLRQQVPQLLRDFAASLSVPSLHLIPI